MVFVNRYSKNDAVNYFDSKEFQNESESFTLAVGQTEGKALITKIADNGDIIWEKVYDTGQGSLVFEKVIQLSPKSSNDAPGFQYILFAREGDDCYLISINSDDGSLFWKSKLGWAASPTNVQLIESDEEYEFFLVFSRFGLDLSVFRFDSSGTLSLKRAFQFNSPNVLINSVDFNSGELALAGYQDLGGAEFGLLLLLDRNMKVNQSLEFNSHRAQFHDVKIADNRYILSGGLQNERAIFLTEFDKAGNWRMYEFPPSLDISSRISLAQSGFYVLQNTSVHGILNYFDFGFNPIWTKELTVNGSDNSISEFSYKISTDDITTFGLNDLGESIAIQTSASFNSCATKVLKPPSITIKTIRIIDVNVRDVQVNLNESNINIGLNPLNSSVVQICPPQFPDYNDVVDITSITSLQSPSFYIQAAGSDGTESTAGLHSRWVFRGVLGDSHLPKGNAASSSFNFNKPNDFVTIYRAKYRPFKSTLNLFDSPNAVDDTNRVWIYQLGTTSAYVYFRSPSQYDSSRGQFDPLSQTESFYSDYGSELVEIELHNGLFFKVGLAVSNLQTNPSLQTETLSTNDNTAMSVRGLSNRRTYNNPSNQNVELLCDNGKIVRFRAISCNVQFVHFETYLDFIEGINLDQDWMNLGEFALTDQDQVAFSRLEPQQNSVNGQWKRFNGSSYVNVNNYQNRFSGAVPQGDRNMQNVVQAYIQLSDPQDNPTALEDIPIDSTEGEVVTISNLELLRIASADFHVARMMGLGMIDLHEDVFMDSHVYVAEYTTFGDFGDGNGETEVHHLAMTLPTSTDDHRLPEPIELDYILPGVFYPGEDDPSEITDEDGYTHDGLFRYITLYMKAIDVDLLNPPFYVDTANVNVSSKTPSVFGGLEHKLSTEQNWRNPEISNDSEYQNADGTTNETVPLVIPDEELIYHIHRQEEEGTHEYLGYGINWFSRSGLGNTIVSIETIIESQKPLIPPTNCFAHLIRQENPLLLTSLEEQTRYGSNPLSDKTLVRMSFDFHAFHDKVDHPISLDNEATDQELLDPANANDPLILFPDDQENFGDHVEIFFRENPPLSVSGQITSISDHPTQINLAIVTTGPYYIASTDQTLFPEIPINQAQNYVGGSLVIGNQISVIESVTVNGSTVEFVVYKKIDGHSILDSDSPGVSENLFETLEIFGDGYFNAIENMQEISNWGTPNPHPTLVNIGNNWNIHRELLNTVNSEGDEQRLIEKTRGIWHDNVLVEEVMEPEEVLDVDGNVQYNPDGTVVTQDVHKGLYKFTFNGFQLNQHSQFSSDSFSVEWYQGTVRVHTAASFSNGQAVSTRKILKVDKIENVVYPNDTPTDLIVYATDHSFSDSTGYTPILTGAGIDVNFYPGYKVYLYENTGLNLNEGTTLPDNSNEEEDEKIVVFGLRVYDPDNILHSKMGTPFLMVSQKIIEALPPGEPSGPLYATRPDFYGRATYTFTTQYQHTPYGVLAFRANEDMFLNALYSRNTIAQIQSKLEELGGVEEEFFTDRWDNFTDWDVLEGGDYSFYPPGADPDEGYKFPNPDKQAFFDWANSINQELGLDPITDPPGSLAVGDPKIFNFVKGALFSCMAPLTEIPIIYSRIKGSDYTPVNKPQKIKSPNGTFLSPSSSAYEMAPMMKRISSSPPTTQFTDFTLDGSSRNFYFYAMREMSSQLKLGEFSPITKPIQLVNTFPAEAPEIVRIRPILANANLNIPAAVELEINAFDKVQNIHQVQVYRALTKIDAQSVRTMTQLEPESVLSQANNETWVVKDTFEGVDQIPFGEPLFYRVAVKRKVNYIDYDLVGVSGAEPKVTEYASSKPSKISASVIVETEKPPSPELKYASEPINTGGFLNGVVLFWDRTCYNGTYFIFKRSSQGSWQKIYTIQSNDITIYVPLLDTTLATDQLATEDPNKNPLYHHFKIEVENSAGLRSTDEKVRTIYIADEWIDESTLPPF